MFNNSRNIAISGGNFTVNTGNLTAFESLQNACAPSAFHNSSARFDPPKCHPNTRVAVLKYLMGWIFGRDHPEALIIWLYGPVGAGKSAILQTIAERCVERKVLVASFFFGRSDTTRNTFKPLVATIAYQIATTIPEIKPVIDRIIERDPLIFDKSIDTQVQSLIVEPLKHLAASGFFNDSSNFAHLLILIDGLDECDDPRMQSMILRALANALSDENVPLIFLIASRPEQHLTLTFNSAPLAELWRSLVLDDSYKPDDDIRLFLEDSFRDIKATHPYRHLVLEAWPEPSDIDRLIQKSSGQFIYASVVVTYVLSSGDRPPRRLEVVMGLRPVRGDVPFAELDALYMHLLRSCTDPDIVLSILGLFICLDECVANLEVHLDLEPGDVEIALAPLTSIINVYKHKVYTRNGEVIYRFIELWHASFIDFLVDKSRSGPFYINVLSVKEHLLPRCISKLMDPYSIIEQFRRMSLHSRSIGQYDLQETLSILVASFRPPQRDIPLTETVENALREFSLLQFWSIWLNARSRFVELSHPAFVVRTFLTFLSENDHENDPDPPPFFALIYKPHLSSFEPIILSQVPKYSQDVGLTSLVVLTSVLCSNKYSREFHIWNEETVCQTLFRLTEESVKFDHGCLYLQTYHGRALLATHYHYLFTGPGKCVEVCPDSHKHAQVALRILEYLCNHPPRRIPRPKFRTRRPHSMKSYNVGIIAVSNPNLLSFMSHDMVIRRMLLAGGSFLRKQREVKHRRGITLSTPHKARSPPYDFESPYYICRFGLLLLSDILAQSSYSQELVDFIRRQGKNIVFMPVLTRKAICAMHEYLDRSNEGANMVE